MKEEKLKKIISKGTVETSDDFINTLMNAIEVRQKTKKGSFWWSFRTILISCSILTVIITGLLFNLLDNEKGIFSSDIMNIPKTPVFVIVTFALLYYINSIISLQNRNRKKNIPT